jgi:hypothetical protein
MQDTQKVEVKLDSQTSGQYLNLGPAQLKAGMFTHPQHSVRILENFVF